MNGKMVTTISATLKQLQQFEYRAKSGYHLRHHPVSGFSAVIRWQNEE